MDNYEEMHAKLNAAFARVENKTNWKLPINCQVLIKDDEDMALIKEAVVFFTGSVPTFEIIVERVLNKPGYYYRVRAAGYYATIGA